MMVVVIDKIMDPDHSIYNEANEMNVKSEEEKLNLR